MRLEAETLLVHHAELAAFDPDRRERLGELFHAALALSSDHRDAYLDLACADDAELRREVQSLLVHATDGDFLEQAHAPLTEGETALARLHIRDEVQFPGPSTTLSPGSRGSGGGSDEAAGAADERDPLVGKRLGVHLVQRKIGEGGMGVVYLALDTMLHRHVAIKALKREYATNQERRKRLVAEAQTAARLSHPNVAAVHGMHQEGEDLYIVSEFVDGPTLRDVVSMGPMEYQRLVRVFLAVAQGLAAAHTLGIVHRDLKPENIMLTAEDLPKIVDFGLAKSTRTIIESSTRFETHPGQRAGTPAYMAPEQLDDLPSSALDFRVDLFAFGVTLYEAATGVHPFAGQSLATTFENIKRAHPTSITRPGVDLGRLDGIVQRCLEKDPAKRYGDTRDLVADLEQLKPGSRPAVAAPVALPPAPPRPTWWWEVHQLATTAFCCGTLIFLFAVHRLADPIRTGQALFFLGLVAAVPLVVLRLNLWFSCRHQMKGFPQTRRRLRPWGRALDGLFTAVLGAMAALMFTMNRPGTAWPLVILALVNLVLFLVVEPASERHAFGDDDEPGGGGFR
jgi:hypothetical protein